jgi:hypothetical protein
VKKKCIRNGLLVEIIADIGLSLMHPALCNCIRVVELFVPQCRIRGNVRNTNDQGMTLLSSAPFLLKTPLCVHYQQKEINY